MSRNAKSASDKTASIAFKKGLLQRAMWDELSNEVGNRDGEPHRDGQANHHNGHTGITVLSDDGSLRVTVPCDCDFEQNVIPKHARRFTGFEDRMTAMHARGTIVREIRGFLAQRYGTSVSSDFISSVTGGVLVDVSVWGSAPSSLSTPSSSSMPCVQKLVMNASSGIWPCCPRRAS